MTISLKDFIPGVRVEVIGCPEAIMLKAILDTIRDLSGTQVWTQDLFAISLGASFTEYDIDLPPDTALMGITTAKYNGNNVPIYTSDEMDYSINSWRDNASAGIVNTITAVIIDGNSEVRVYPIPIVDEDDCLLLRAALKPSSKATTCGSVFTDLYEIIEQGALARLKASTGKWGNPADVPYHASMYRKGRARTRGKVLRGRSDNSLVLKGRSLA